MINETKLSKQLMEAIRRECRGAFVFKHGGNFVGGWPDVSASYLGETFLFEDKLLRKGESYRKLFRGRQAQLVTCHQLNVTTNGKCWVVVFTEQPKRTQIWTPRALGQYIFPKVILPLEGEADLQGQHVPDWTVGSMPARVLNHGMIWTDGWEPDFVVQLMKDYLCRRN